MSWEHRKPAGGDDLPPGRTMTIACRPMSALLMLTPCARAPASRKRSGPRAACSPAKRRAHDPKSSLTCEMIHDDPRLCRSVTEYRCVCVCVCTCCMWLLQREYVWMWYVCTCACAMCMCMHVYMCMYMGMYILWVHVG